MSALKQVSLCVRCGKCLISCPTYSVLPLETLSPRGRVGLLDAIAKQQMDYQYAIKSLASCLLCARCEKACELKIPVTKAIAEVRHKMSTSSIPDFTESAIRLAFGTPESQRRNLRLLTKLKGLLPAGYVGGLLYRLLRLDSRAAAIVQELKKTTFTDLHGRENRADAALFVGCAVNYLFHSTGGSAMSLLEKIGIFPAIPKTQNCCGLILWAIGDEEGAKRLAEKNIETFKDYEKVIFICRSCSYTIRELYPELVGKHGKALSESAYDITDVIAGNCESLDFVESEQGAEFHIACHAELTKSELMFLRDMKISVEDKGCCGGGGSFGFKFSNMSRKLAEKRLAKLAQTELLTDCLGCYIQLKYLRIREDVNVRHAVEWLDERIKTDGKKQS